MSKKAGKILMGLSSGMKQGLDIYQKIAEAPIRAETAAADLAFKKAQTEWLKIRAANPGGSVAPSLDYQPPDSPNFGLGDLAQGLNQAMEGTGASPKFFTPNTPTHSSLANVGGNIQQVPNDVQRLVNAETNRGYPAITAQTAQINQFLKGIKPTENPATGVFDTLKSGAMMGAQQQLKTLPTKEDFYQTKLQDILKKTQAPVPQSGGQTVTRNGKTYQLTPGADPTKKESWVEL